MGVFDKLFGKKDEKSPEPAFMCEPKTVYSPMKGTVIPLEQVEDPAFAQGIMGKGVGIEPQEGKLYAPVEGEIAAVFPTGHAIGIKTADGMELLLHIGIDTVSMNGEGFRPCVRQGEFVKAGTLLVEFDCDKIKKAGYKTTTMVLVSNADMMGEMTKPLLGEKEKLEPLYSFQ